MSLVFRKPRCLVLAAAAWVGFAATPASPQNADEPLLHESQLSPSVLETIEKFLQKHDSLIATGDHENLFELYAPSFSSADLAVASRAEMTRLWQVLKVNYPDAMLRTDIRRVDGLGDFYMVSGCRPFIGQPAIGDGVVTDDLCASLLLRNTGEVGLQVYDVFEIDHEKFSRFDDNSSTYRCDEFFFELKYQF